ncbi:glutamine synthetase family protein [Kitasatospora sp. NPDC058965]|uniref:glutamine synthetase family protein n=1 Tax=Kitasatospora sp. NPDC058965 TaxID=3346682 RepID=UPI0036ADB78E
MPQSAAPYDLGAEQLDTVLVATVDPHGRLKGKEIDAIHYRAHLASACTLQAPAYLLATDLGMTPVPGYSRRHRYGDLTLRLDHGTWRPLPWLPGTALLLADPIDSAGTDLPIAPRAVLRHQLALLAELGYHARCALESEFMLYQGRASNLAKLPAAGWKPATGTSSDFALDHPPAVRAFTRALRTAMRTAGLPVEAVKAETAPGQVELTFHHSEPMQACDQHLLMKHAARTLGDTHHLAPVFMAAPQNGIGNGLHIHLSLWRGDTPITPGPGLAGLSQLGQHAVAGLLNNLPHLAVLYAPTTNSYKRYTGQVFAPARWTWGPDNRTCAVRIAGTGANTRLEIRVPGADANPYLALAAALAAIRDGITQHSTPPPTETGNAYHTDAPHLPRTLDHALAGFNANAPSLLGPETVSHYAALAQAEIDYQHGHVTDTETQRGLAC